MKYIVLILFVFLFDSCGPPRIPLTDQEKALQEKFAKECKCKVILGHSWDAITKRRTDGYFYMNFEFDSADKFEYCNKSEKWLHIYSQIRAKQLLKILSHKENYKEISVGYGVTKEWSASSSQTTCSKLLIYDFRSGKTTFKNVLGLNE